MSLGRQLALLGCTAAAMQPGQGRGTFKKHITKPSEQVAAPGCAFPDTRYPLYVINFPHQHFRQALAAVRYRDDAGAVPGLPAAPDRPPGGVFLADRVPVADEAEQRGGGKRDDEGHQQG